MHVLLIVAGLTFAVLVSTLFDRVHGFASTGVPGSRYLRRHGRSRWLVGLAVGGYVVGLVAATTAMAMTYLPRAQQAPNVTVFAFFAAVFLVPELVRAGFEVFSGSSPVLNRQGILFYETRASLRRVGTLRAGVVGVIELCLAATVMAVS